MQQGRMMEAVESLRKLTRTYRLDKIADELTDTEPSFRHYAEFEKVLEGFARVFRNCAGCAASGGDPNCSIRECCRRRSYTSCLECLEMDACEKLKAQLFQQCVIRTLKASPKIST